VTHRMDQHLKAQAYAVLYSHLAKPMELKKHHAFLEYGGVQDYLNGAHCAHSDRQHFEVSLEYYP
jgi:hypothetical protein